MQTSIPTILISCHFTVRFDSGLSLIRNTRMQKKSFFISFSLFLFVVSSAADQAVCPPYELLRIITSYYELIRVNIIHHMTSGGCLLCPHRCQGVRGRRVLLLSLPLVSPFLGIRVLLGTDTLHMLPGTS